MRDAPKNDIFDFFSGISEDFARKYQRAPDFQERFRVWTALLDRYMTPGGLAVDVGCGSGIFSVYLAKKGMKVIGIDAAEKMIALCERQKAELKLGHLRFFHAELPQLHIVPPQRADLMISSSVLEYVSDLEASLTRMIGLLKEDGTLIVSMPNAYGIYRKWESWLYRQAGFPRYYKYVKNVMTQEQLESLLAKHGFKVREVHYYAHRAVISRFLRLLKFNERYTENLFVAVFGRGNVSAA